MAVATVKGINPSYGSARDPDDIDTLIELAEAYSGPVFKPRGHPSGTDDTDELQGTFQRAKSAGCGRIELPYSPDGPWKYESLDLSDMRNIELVGAGSAGSRWASGLVSELVCTASGANPAISLASTQGVAFRNLRLRYSHASFTGPLVKFGHSAAASDPAYFGAHNCSFEGTVGVATSSARLIDTDKLLSSEIRMCRFQTAAEAISRPASYCNILKIDTCTFLGLTNPPIRNPGESWTVQACTFEPLASGAAGAVIYDAAQWAYDFNYLGNWHGDVSQAGGNWVNIKGLGPVFVGNRFTTALGTGYAIGLQAGTQNPAIVGGRMETAVGVNFLGAPILGGAMVGVDMQSATPLANEGNAPDFTVFGCAPLPNRIPIPSHTVAGLPSIPSSPLLIYVSDEAGGAVPAFSDGTNWRRVTDRAVVS